MRGLIAIITASLLLACSEDESSGGGGVAGSAGAAGNAGSSGAAGSSGVSGSAGSAGTGGSGGSGGSAGATASCTLTESGPIAASADGQVIERLRISSTSGAALSVEGLSNVVVRDVEILHAGGPGIAFSNADGIRIERVHIVHSGAPPSGPNPSDQTVNISGYSSASVVITHVKLERGSSGVYLLESPGASLSFVEGHDFRGPFPRGQLVQFDKSSDCVLEDFSCENPVAESWPEDNVSVYQSSNVSVRRGLIVGNNSPSGVGVMFEQSDATSSGGIAEDVDTIDMGNGSFSAYPGRDVVFRRTRARDNHCGGQAGRDPPLSNALVWAGSPGSDNIAIEDSRYFALCNPGNTVWDQSVFSTIQISEQDFTPRAAIDEIFCWQ